MPLHDLAEWQVGEGTLAVPGARSRGESPQVGMWKVGLLTCFLDRPQYPPNFRYAEVERSPSPA